MVYLPMYQIPNDHISVAVRHIGVSEVKTSGGSLQDPSSSAMCAMGPWGCGTETVTSINWDIPGLVSIQKTMENHRF